jgi:hypothetical protein
MRGSAFMNLNKSEQGLEDYKTAARLGSKEAMEFLKNKGIAW